MQRHPDPVTREELRGFVRNFINIMGGFTLRIEDEEIRDNTLRYFSKCIIIFISYFHIFKLFIYITDQRFGRIIRHVDRLVRTQEREQRARQQERDES